MLSLFSLLNKASLILGLLIINTIDLKSTPRLNIVTTVGSTFLFKFNLETKGFLALSVTCVIKADITNCFLYNAGSVFFVL